MTSGGQCVMICGTPLMLQWCASSWDMHTQEVSIFSCAVCDDYWDNTYTNVYSGVQTIEIHLHWE